MNFLVPYIIGCEPFLLNHWFADNGFTAKTTKMLCSSLLRLVVASSIHLPQSRFNHAQVRSSRIIFCISYLVDLLSTKWCSHIEQKVTMLREAIIRNQIALKFCVLSLVTTTAVLLAFLSAPSLTLNQVSAQITPSITPVPADLRIGYMAQDSADPVQNSTSANITQLATVLPVANQPITPASYTPLVEETEDSDSASSEDDDYDSASSSSDNDNGDDSDNDNGDDDGDGGGSFAFAGGGGAFAFAG